MPCYAATRRPANRRNRLTLGLVAVLATAPLGGCMTGRDATGSIALAPLPDTDAGLRDYAATWRGKHEADPGNAVAAVNYARALRGLTRYAEAAAVLEDAAAKHPNDHAVLAAYGKALADAGRFREAADVLSRAHTPDKPDWSVLSAQGSVADQLGDHAAAVGYYEAALKIRPGEPSVLSNLGLSYALTKQLAAAEQAMRAAAANPKADMRVRQNYALVLSLEGKFKEAEGVAATDLSQADAVASVEAIRQTIERDGRWRAVKLGGPEAPTADGG